MSTEALAQLHELKAVNDIYHVEQSITYLKSILLELRGSVDMPSEGSIVGLLRTMYSSNNKLS